jgi:hypothetical protein
MDMRSKNIELHIEELILHDFAGSDHSSIGEAIKSELSRLFTEQGVPPSLERGGRIDSLKGGDFKITPGPSAEVTGARVARAVYGGLKR